MTQQIKTNQIHSTGSVALTAVILVSAVIGLIIVSISVQTIDESQISIAFEKSKQEKFNVISCAENILLEISNNDAYSLPNSFNIDLGGTDSIYCATSTITDVPGTGHVLRIESGDEFVSKLEVIIATTTPEIEISSFNFVE